MISKRLHLIQPHSYQNDKISLNLYHVQNKNQTELFTKQFNLDKNEKQLIYNVRKELVGVNYQFKCINELREQYSDYSQPINKYLTDKQQNEHQQSELKNIQNFGNELQQNRLLLPYVSNPMHNHNEIEYGSIFYRKISMNNLNKHMTDDQILEIVQNQSQNQVLNYQIPRADDATLVDDINAKNKGYGVFELSSERAAKITIINSILNKIANNSSELAYFTQFDSEYENDINQIKSILYNTSKNQSSNQNNKINEIERKIDKMKTSHKDQIRSTQTINNNNDLSSKFAIDNQIEKMNSHEVIWGDDIKQNLPNEEDSDNILNNYARSVNQSSRSDSISSKYNKILFSLNNDQNNKEFDSQLRSEQNLNTDDLLNEFDDNLNQLLDKLKNNNESNSIFLNNQNIICRQLENNKYKNNSTQNIKKKIDTNDELSYLKNNQLDKQQERGRLHSKHSINPQNFGLRYGQFEDKLASNDKDNQMNQITDQINSLSVQYCLNIQTNLEKKNEINDERLKNEIKKLDFKDKNRKLDFIHQLILDKLTGRTIMPNNPKYNLITKLKETNLGNIKLEDKYKVEQVIGLDQQFESQINSIYNINLVNQGNLLTYEDVYNINKTQDELNCQNPAEFKGIVNRIRYDNRHSSLNQSDLLGSYLSNLSNHNEIQQSNQFKINSSNPNIQNLNLDTDDLLKLKSTINQNEVSDELFEHEIYENIDGYQHNEYHQIQNDESVDQFAKQDRQAIAFIKATQDINKIEKIKINMGINVCEESQTNLINELNSSISIRNLENRLQQKDNNIRSRFEQQFQKHQYELNNDLQWESYDEWDLQQLNNNTKSNEMNATYDSRVQWAARMEDANRLVNDQYVKHAE